MPGPGSPGGIRGETRRRMTAAERRGQILERAAELFAEDGYAATRTRAIADACGIQEAILFRHFSSKEEIFRRALEESIAAHDHEGFLADLGDDLETLELFRRIARRILDIGNDDPRLLRLLIGAAVAGTPDTQSLYMKWRVPFVTFLEHRIRDRIDRGEFRHVDARLTARAFVGMVMDCALSCDLWSRLGYAETTPDELVGNNVPTFVRGLLVEPPPDGR